jgi:MFS family permease
MNEESPLIALAGPPKPAKRTSPLLVVIILMMLAVCLCAGTLYVFGLIAPDLKTRLGFSQEALNLMFSFVYVGSGLLVAPINLFVNRIGPIKLLVAMSLLCALCWSLVLLASYFVISYSVAAFCVYFCLIGLSLASYFTIFIVWIAPRISPQRMPALQSLMVAFYGVGGAVCTVIYMFVFEQQPDGVVRFMILLTALYTGPALITALLMVIYQCRTVSTAPAVEAENPTLQGKDSAPVAAAPPAASLPRLMLDVVKSARFWFLFAELFMAMAVGAGVQANLGNMVLSLGESPQTISYLEIVFAIGQAVGRLGFAFLTNVRLPLPYVLLLPLPLLLQFVGCMLYLAPFPAPLLPVLVALAAVGYGGAWSVAPTLVSHLPHGTRFGEVWALVVLGPGFGPLAVDAIIGKLYDIHVEPGQQLCLAGVLCFRWGMILASACAFVGAIFAAMFVAAVWRDARQAQLKASAERAGKCC